MSLNILESDLYRRLLCGQVLEVAVISHSFIIGLSLGISENTRSITPLLAALSFHQLFEGFALGGSICQVSFIVAIPNALRFCSCLCSNFEVAVNFSLL